MSRIGKKIITIPEKVTVSIAAGSIKVKGPLGELSEKIHPLVTIVQEQNTLKVSVKDPNDKLSRSLWGTFGSLVANMITGVTTGFSKTLEIVGIGFTWDVKGQKLNLKIGYSHPVTYDLPVGITGKAVKNVLTITGISKQLIGKVASEIRGLKKPEPYKGKGIRYAGEVIHKKAGKQATSTAGS